MGPSLPKPLDEVCESERRTAARHGARILAYCALGLIPLLALLDAHAFPEYAWPLRAWRLATLLATGIVLALLRRGLGARRPLALGVGVTLMVGANVDAMGTLVSGGSLPHYAFVIVVLLIASIVLPWPPRTAVLTGGTLVVAYVAGTLLSGVPAEPARFVYRALLVAATAVLVVAAAYTSERRRRVEILRRREIDAHARYHQAVAQLGQLGLAEVELPLLLERAVGLVAETLGLEHVSLLHATADQEALTLDAGVGWKHARKERQPLAAGAGTLLGRALRSAQPTIVDDLRAASDLEAPALLRAHAIVATALVPITGPDRSLGMLGAHATAPRTFTRREIEFLQSVARIVATAMCQRVTRAATVEETATTAALARVGRELIATLDGPGLLQRLCRLTADVLGCDLSTTWLLDAAEGVYRPLEGHGLEPAQWERLRGTPLPADLTRGVVARLGSEGILEVAAHDATAPLVGRILAGAGIGRALLVALRDDGEVVGIQASGYVDPAAVFTPAQKRIGIGVAQLASIALMNAHLVEELEQANRLKTEFVATMSHELRTPLNVIIGYADMLGEELTPAEHDALLARLRGSAVDLLELIETTLNLNRMAAGPAALVREPIDARALLDELGTDFRAAHGHDAVTLRWQAEDGLVLRTDRRKLKSILQNLIGNALKFTVAGEVAIECRRIDAAHLFTVRDTGPGIPADRLSQVFDMFCQLDAPQVRAGRGVGLGLYIVQRLVRQLGGTIEVESEVGRGTTFRVVVPEAGTPRAARAAAEAQRSGIGTTANGTEALLARTRQNLRQVDQMVGAVGPAPAARKRLLFADDLPLNRMLLQRVLREELPEVEVLEAADGAEAVAMVEAQPPDLVLMDLYMPQMDGWEAIRRIRQLQDMGELPIIALSATVAPHTEALALRAGCNEFLPKPISDYRPLKERIAYWLGLTLPDARPPGAEPRATSPRLV